MSLSSLRELLDGCVQGDPREFVAAFEDNMSRNGAPLPLAAAVSRWNRGEL
jgi:hypothetical protein